MYEDIDEFVVPGLSMVSESQSRPCDGVFLCVFGTQVNAIEGFKAWLHVM